jgi:hypothetical protein
MNRGAGTQSSQPIVGSDLEAVRAAMRELLGGAEISAEEQSHFDYLITRSLSEHGLPKIDGDDRVHKLAARALARLCLLGAVTPAGLSSAAEAGQGAVMAAPPRIAAPLEDAATQSPAEFAPSEAAMPQAWDTHQGAEYVAANILPTDAASAEPAFVPSVQRSATYLERAEQRQAFIEALVAELKELSLIDDDAVQTFVAILVDLIMRLAAEGRRDFDRIWLPPPTSDESAKAKQPGSGAS